MKEYEIIIAQHASQVVSKIQESKDDIDFVSIVNYFTSVNLFFCSHTTANDRLGSMLWEAWRKPSSEQSILELCILTFRNSFGRSFNMVTKGDKDGIWNTLERWAL